MVNRKALVFASAMLLVGLILGSFTVSSIISTEAQDTATTAPDMRMYLRLDNIQGESTDRNHENWIDIIAFNWTEAMNSFLGGILTGNVKIGDFTFFAHTSKASPKLFLAAAIGTVMPLSVLECWTPIGDGGQVEFLEFRFDNAIIASYNIAANATDYRPMDQFSITFSRIRMTYWTIQADGTQGSMTTAWYDLGKRQGGQ